MSRSFPLDCRALQFGICVVDAPMEATPFTLAVRTSSQCNFRGLHPQVAQRILTAFAHSAAFAPFEPIPWAIDSIRFFNTAGNTPPASSSTDLTWRVGVAKQIEEVHDLLELTFQNSDDYLVMVHRPGIAPMAVEASRTWSAARLADAISEAVGTHVDVHWPGLFSRGTDALIHALLEPPAGLAEDHTLVLFDAAELHPIGPRFVTRAVPSRLTLGEIFCLVREAFPDAYYPSEIQVNGRVLETSGLRRYYCPVIRPVSRMSAIRRPGHALVTGIRPQTLIERIPGLALDLQQAQREHAEQASSSAYSEEVTGTSLLQMHARRSSAIQPCQQCTSFPFRVWRPGSRAHDLAIPANGSFQDAEQAMSRVYTDFQISWIVPVFPQHEGPFQCVLPASTAQKDEHTILLEHVKEGLQQAVTVSTHDTADTICARLGLHSGHFAVDGQPWEPQQHGCYTGMRVHFCQHPAAQGSARRRALPTPCRSRAKITAAENAVGETTLQARDAEALGGACAAKSRVDAKYAPARVAVRLCLADVLPCPSWGTRQRSISAALLIPHSKF